MTISVRQITDVVATHGEGPVWAPSWGAFRFLDLLAGDIFQLEDDGSVDRRSVGQIVALTRPRRDGGWICVTDEGLITSEADGLYSPLTRKHGLWSDPEVRPNEGGCAPDGSLLMGSMAWNGAPGRGELLQINPQGDLTSVLPNVGVSNGIGWTVDGGHAYYVDSTAGTIDRFAWNKGAGLTAREEWATVSGNGSADGLAVDTAGGVWVAMYGAGEIHHFRHDGELVDVISIPTSQPTSLAFGGRNYNRLIVTTSPHGLSTPEPAAGAVFEIVNHGATGVPTHAFSG